MRGDRVEEQLNNGAKVLERNGEVVLCDYRGEYVTWRTTDDGDAFWGHYFGGDLIGATMDFVKRAQALQFG